MEPGPQHLWGHSRAHTSAHIFGHLGDWGMSLILGLWLMVALIGGWGPQQRLGHTCSQLEKQTRGHPATSSISWKRFLVQHGLGHDGRHVWGEQAGATHETGFGFFDVGVAVGRAKEWQRLKTVFIPVLVKSFTTIGSNVVIWLANLPFSARVQATLSCQRVTQWSRTERTVLFDVIVVKKKIHKQIDNGTAWSVLIYNDIRHHKGQNLLWTDSAAPRDTTTFFCDDMTLWWRMSLLITVQTTLNQCRVIHSRYPLEPSDLKQKTNLELLTCGCLSVHKVFSE